MKTLKLLAVALICIGLGGLKAQTVTDTVIDIDSNFYKTVTIGTQIWMAENLKVAHYADGTPIPYVTDNAIWNVLTATGKAYCWYNNDSTTNAKTYGALYTWAAAMNGAVSSSSVPSGVQGVCPTGWHLPSDNEWETLITYLGGWEVAGYELKRNGFKALPGGFRRDDGLFDNINDLGDWWSATEYSTSNAGHRRIFYDYPDVLGGPEIKKCGFSIRCVNDTSAINPSVPDFLNIDESILYPNPATEMLYFKNSNYTNATIMIFDLQGKQVLTRQIDSESIDISNLRQGIYIVKIVCPEKIMIAKFIKE